MGIERNKFLAKKSFLRAIILLILCTPLLLVAVLKLFYFLPVSPHPITAGIAKGLGDIVSKIYQTFEPIQWLWPVAPTPTVGQVITFGNVMTVILFVGFLWGMASIQFGVEKIDELSEAKKRARQRQLEDEYRAKR